jgi:hypothetical protein
MIWKQLLYALELASRCEGTSCEIYQPQALSGQQTKPGMMIVTGRFMKETSTTCGYTAPGVAVCMLFLQIMGSPLIYDFIIHSKQCIGGPRIDTTRVVEERNRRIDLDIVDIADIVIDNDDTLIDKLLLYDDIIMLPNSPKLYERLNTVISQLYDSHQDYQTGINYMFNKRPDLFQYTGLKPGINIISIHANMEPPGYTIHHSFIYNIGSVSVVIDSWAHSNMQWEYIVGREATPRIWDTQMLSELLEVLNPACPSRNIHSLEEVMLKVFLAPHLSNIDYYVTSDMTEPQRQLIHQEIAQIDTGAYMYYQILSTNQNFIMTTFLFNFDFTAHILFGGKKTNRLRRKRSKYEPTKKTTRKGTTRKGTNRKRTNRKGTTRKGTNHKRTNHKK